MSNPHARALFRSALCAALLGFGWGPAIAAEASAGQDSAGNRIEAFEALSAEASITGNVTDSAIHCTADRRWCAQLRTDTQTRRLWLEVHDRMMPLRKRKFLRYELPEDEGDEPPTLWPRIVRMHDDQRSGRGRLAMIGVVMHLRAGYSGGGAGADRLVLIKVDPGSGRAAFAEVLSVPLNGSAMIRACFSEEDAKHRAGACHDQYSFSATLALLDASSSSTVPQFTYETEATTFPGRVSRSEDSLDNPPLAEKDLVTVINEECSYRRILSFDPAAGRYQFDLPVPDCSDFTEP